MTTDPRRRPGAGRESPVARRTAAWAVAALLAAGVCACGSSGTPADPTSRAAVTAEQSGQPTATATTTATTTATATVTVTAAAGSSATDTGSGTPTVPTSGTEYLSETDSLSSAYGLNTGAAVVNGHDYARSVLLRADQTSVPTNDAEYNLGRSWKTFDTTVGIRDDSPTGSLLTFEVLVDGTQAFSETLPLGQTRDVHLDVSNALRLKIVVSYAAAVAPADYTYGVWGDARLGS